MITIFRNNEPIPSKLDEGFLHLKYQMHY